MKSKITINVSFNAGTDIRSAITEAKAKAALWDVAFVDFDFNGVSFSVTREADVQYLMEYWDSVKCSKNSFVMG